MAIVFNCPSCGTNYRLKDELGGKSATCKNPSCRKVIQIPKPKDMVLATKPVDVDAIAAAAFSDEPPKAAETTVEETIQVTCSGCDHVWSVEASKEGKNVLCPECRKPNRVPPRKKVEKADWRTGPNRPSLAKVESGMDVQGAFTSANVEGISTQTAQEIVRERDAEEEPEERRKKFIKRSVLALLLVGGLAVTGFFAAKGWKEVKLDTDISKAVDEVTGKEGSTDPRFHALIHRAAGEHYIRNAATAGDAKKALQELQKARNLLARERPGSDRSFATAEVAVTMTELLGTTPEQIDKGLRYPKDVVVKEIRQTLQGIADPELLGDVMRSLTRKFVEKGQPTAAEDIARQLPQPNELLGQIGLELLRLDREKHKSDAEKLVSSATGEDAASIQTLRLVLGKPVANKDAAPAPPQVSYAEASALTGNLPTATQAARNAGKPQDRLLSIIAAAQAAPDAQVSEAAALAEQALPLFKNDPKMVPPSVGIRLCRVLARLGRVELAESVAAVLPDDQSKGWARVEILRAQLARSKDQKAEDAWLDPLGDPDKNLAAVKAREEVARHNAAVGHEYRAVISTWPKGTVQPFGKAGSILGSQDRK